MEAENIEQKIREILLAELERQTGSVRQEQGGRVTISGPINLDDLAMAVAGALAGGP